MGKHSWWEQQLVLSHLIATSMICRFVMSLLFYVHISFSGSYQLDNVYSFRFVQYKFWKNTDLIDPEYISYMNEWLPIVVLNNHFACLIGLVFFRVFT